MLKRLSASSGAPMREMLDTCKASVRRLIPDAEVVLFGSRARGVGEPDSDYDLLVLCDAEDTEELSQKIRDALYDVALAHDVIVSAFVYSRSRWNSPLLRASPFHERVEAEGVLV